MFNWLKRRTPGQATAHRLYDAIVTQARQPEFFTTFDVADDVAGRFEMICVHIFTVLERLGTAKATETVGRDLIERFFRDMDDEMREMGVGDTTVPKKMRKTSEGLYGRINAYGQALREADGAAINQALSAALARNVYGDESRAEETEVRALSGYVRQAVLHLDDIDDEVVTGDGNISFPSLGGPQFGAEKKQAGLAQ
ncbi:MAG: ubiquinol-cytochrome C chaperone family protein [Pseudomonadota bacterium]